LHETNQYQSKTPESAKARISGVIRELVFGSEDGLLSALGLVTGVAAGTTNPSIILLAGIVGGISGAISMGAGNYLGIKSQMEVLQKRIREEEEEIRSHPDHESAELTSYYHERGLTPDEVKVIIPAIMRNKDLLMEEMAAHELHINADNLESPIMKSVWMFVAFVCGAVLPIWPYAVFNHQLALIVSIITAAVAVFGIGIGKTLVTGLNPVKSGFEMLAVAASAGLVGYFAGHLVGISGV
jgi:vacuolar iron transporter family protein